MMGRVVMLKNSQCVRKLVQISEEAHEINSLIVFMNGHEKIRTILNGDSNNCQKKRFSAGY